MLMSFNRKTFILISRLGNGPTMLRRPYSKHEGLMFPSSILKVLFMHRVFQAYSNPCFDLRRQIFYSL